MAKEIFYTIYQVADLLGMHHKTIRNFIAEGKLGATKVGKQWRISDSDLSAFMEKDNKKSEGKIEGETSLEFMTNTMSTDITKRKITVSSVIDINDISKSEYMRLSNTLIASMNSRDTKFQDSTLHVKYYESERQLKILLWGPVKFIESMMELVTMLLESN